MRRSIPDHAAADAGLCTEIPGFKSCSRLFRFNLLLVLGFRYRRGAQAAGTTGFRAEQLTRFWNFARFTKGTLGAHQFRPGRRRAIYGKLRLNADFVPKLIADSPLAGTQAWSRR